MKIKNNITLTIAIITILLIGCSSVKTGKLTFRANGEDFVRNGFIDKNNWNITFKNLYINLSDITAYNEKENLNVKLTKEYFIDLAKGDKNAKTILIDTLKKTKIGNYQSLKFKLKRKSSGEYNGYSIVMIGKAEKNKKNIPFTIKLDEEISFDGKEGYVGDEIKGLLTENGISDVELTFHFDHLFGDINADKNDHVNTGSVGFDFFYTNDSLKTVEVSQADLINKKDYPKFIKALSTMGHLGEGHCHVTEQSTKL